MIRYVSKIAPSPPVFAETPPPPVQSCLEILQFVMQSHTGAERTQCCLWVQVVVVAHFRTVKIQDQLLQISPKRVTNLAW